jgi:hypothetical protein
MSKKRWILEEMKIRVNNLKKVINETLINIYYYRALEETDNELDALYIAYYDLKALSLKYKREVYGTVNNVDYKPKFDWNSYLDEYLKNNINYYTSTASSYTWSTRTYSSYYNLL